MANRSPIGAAPISRPPIFKEFAGENVPQACVAITEPQPLFDPTRLKTTAVRTVRLPARRREVVDPGRRRRRAVYCRRGQLGGKPALFIIEVCGQRPDRQGGSEHGDSRRGVGARSNSAGVSVPLNARLARTKPK